MARKSLSSVTGSCFNCHVVLNPFFYIEIEDTKTTKNEKRKTKKTITTTHKMVTLSIQKSRHFFNIHLIFFLRAFT